MSDNIKVVVKVRPLISREIEDKLSYQWRVKNNALYQLDSSGKESGVQFTFDKVYDESTQTTDVYKDVAKPIVEAAIAGFNGTIFAYGQTSSGKTYTMSGTETSPGIIQLAVLNLFEQIKCIPDRDFLVRVSYIEIYNESLKDLLNGDNDKVKIRDTQQGVKVEATEKFTSSPEEVLDIMKEGDANRQIGATNMNEESSRSHSIFQITIESREHTEGDETAGCVNVSQLNLVDLAGSERAGQTGATGKRFKEGTHINKSLSVLALVIKQLSEDPLRHANYRDSKLTRILQNSLGGNAKTSIICAVTPAAVEETISTLQFANRAKAIKNKPEVNAVATDATKLQDLTKQLSKLQSELAIKNNIEQDNRNLLKQIQSLQKMILNGFGQRSIDIGGARRKTWCAPRRMTISTTSLRPVEEDVEATVQRFCTPSLKYNPLSLPTPRDFQPIQRPSQLPSVSEERAMVTPPPKDRKVNFSEEIIDLDSDDDNASNTSRCSPYHKCFNKSETPPCVLRKNAKLAEKNLKDIVELTNRERLYNPDVVEYMEKLEQSTNKIAKLEEEIKSLNTTNMEKDSEMEQLKDVIKQTKIEIQTFSSSKAELEARCNEYTTQLTDLEVSYETLKAKAKLREDELLSLLSEHTGNKKPKETISGRSLSRTLDKDFGHFMDMSKDISLVSDNDTSIDSSNNEPSGQMQRLIDEMRMEIVAKNEGIVKLETDLLQQKLTIQSLESTCTELRDEINKTNSKLQYTEEENCLLKSSIETLNSTINSQKENLESANNDIQSYHVVIKELQAKIVDRKYDNVDLNVSDTLLDEMISNEEQFIANNENMRNIIHSFKTALKTRSEEIEQLKSNQKCYTDSSNTEMLSEQLEEKEKQIMRLVEEALKSKEQIQENINMTNKLIEDNKDLVKSADDLSSKLSSAEKQSSELEKRVLELEKENKAYNHQLHEFNENHDKLLKNLNDFKSNIAELEKEKEELRELKRKVRDKDDLIAELESKISSKESVINALNNCQTESQNYLYKWKSTITTLHQFLSVHTGEVILPPEFTEDTSIFDILCSQLNYVENSVKEIVSQKELAVAKNNKLQEEIEIVKSQMESVIQNKNKIENDKEKQMELENKLAVINNNKLHEEVEILQSEVESLIQDKNLIINDRDNQLELIIQLKNNIADLEKDLAVANNNKLQEEIGILQSQIESLIQNTNKIENDRDNHIQQVVQLKKDISEIEKELCELNKQNEDLNQKLLLVNQSHDILQSDIIEKDNVITNIKNEEHNLRSQLEKLLQLDVMSRSEIENLQTIIKTNEARFNEILKVKSDEVLASKRDAHRKECLFDETCIELQKISKTLEETIHNRDDMLENIYKAAVILIKKLENHSNEYESIENIIHSNIYHNIIQILGRIKDIIESSNVQVNNCEFHETVELLNMVKEQNHQLLNKLAYIENENSNLTVELEQIRIDNKKITNDLLESDNVIQRLQVELQEKLFIIENLECKINEWKHNFTGLEESMKQQLLELQISNSELESQSQTSMKKHLSIHPSETYTIEPEYPDIDSVQRQHIRNSLNNLMVEPGNYSPQSLLTLCCNKIIDAIQPSDADPNSVASSSNTNFTPTSSAETQTDGCDCERLFTEKNIVLDENLDLKAKVDFLQSVNVNLLKEQEEIRKELKLLVEPANELQKKISSHKTSLSTLTATTYAENKLLKSQVKVLQHHNNRIYNVCQRDLPTFKKSLQELSSILKHTPLVNRLETSIKRFSLPEVLDKNSSVFKDESTLDGDLLMLDTNVTVASVDTTLLVQDQTCLDGTQIYLETDINSDVIETIDPNVLHTQLQMMSVENEKLSGKLNVLKEENLTLHKTIEKLSQNLRPDIRKIDAQSSPIKFDSNLVEVPQEPTENENSKDNLCEYCKNGNIHSLQGKITNEVNVLTKELTEVKCQKSDLEKRCNDLNEDVRAKDQLVSKINALEQDNNKQLIMINKLTNKLSFEHEELTKLQEENDSLSTQLMEGIDESDTLRKELDSLKEINSALSVQCADLEELIKGNTVACVRCARNSNTLDSPVMNKSLLNRSRSDSESSSRCNKLSTLQSELLAGREDCRTISEDVATIKNRLERGNLSMSHNMDLDDSMGESNVFSFPNELHTASPKPNSFKLAAEIPQERLVDMYALDKAECFNYYIEKTGAENNITEEIKIIDLMKMFYNNLVAKHGNEIENLVNKLKDFEETRNQLTEKLDSINSEYAKTNEEIKEKDNRIARIANSLDQIKKNIHNMNEEIASCDADKNTVLVTMFKNNLLNIIDNEFELSSVNVFDKLMDKVVNKHQNDLLEIMNRYSELQGNMELLASELNNVTDNLNEIKCQLSVKEQEYNLLKAQKEKVHEITSAVTLDIVQKERELTKIISNGYRKLIEYNILTPNDIDSSEPVDKKIYILIEKLINQSKQSDLVLQEKHNLTLEITKVKTALEEKEQELESLKCEVEQLRELSKNATKELLIKNEALQTQKSLHEQLDEVYQKKVEENDANARIIENLTQELDILKVTVSEKENLLLSVQLNKQNSDDSETKAKITELMESIKSLEHDNKNLKSVNDVITNESEQNAAQLAQADDTIKKNKTELDKLTAEILTLNKSLKESMDVIESLKLEAKSLVEQNVTLKKEFEEANNLCSRLKLNLKTHEKSAEIQCKIISRLKQEKESSNSVDSEKQKVVNEMSAQMKSLQKDVERLSKDKAECEKEARELRETKESLERRVAELEGQVESLGRPRGSCVNEDARRRRQSLLDSKRTFSEEKLDTDPKKMEAYFASQEKPEDMFMDVDDHSNRSTPAPNRRSDSFQSRNDESDEASRPSSAVARRRRRQSIHDMHRQTHQDIQDHLNTLDEMKINGDSQNSEVTSLRERLQACQQQLEELKERYREVDEECEICAEYLRERDEQCMQLRNEKTDLQQQITELNNKLLNASLVRNQKDAKRTFANASVNTDEDWTNLYSVVVDRMSFDREVEKNKALQRTVHELRFKNGELKTTLAKMQKTAERAARNKANLQELEAAKSELETCKQKLEEYKERCKELDEECDTCGEYLRERDGQLRRLRGDRDELEAKLQALQDKEAGNKAQSVRKKRQSLHDQNRHAAAEAGSRDAATETSVELASLHVERDNLKLISDSLQKENIQLKVALESMSQQRHAMELQLRAAPALLPPVYVATGSAIVQNHQLTEVMKENQKLKKMNAKLITICKKRGKPLVESNRENDDPADIV